MQLEVDIQKQFGDFAFKAAFSINQDKCGVFGPSGTGKTTLMHILAGLLTPDSGHIALNGTVLFDSKQKINLPPEKRRMGVVFQHAHLFPHMDAKKNLFYGLKRIPAKERNIQPEELISALQIEHLLDRSVGKLSGGERQRIALGRTILACPNLILLDEPLSGLDGNLKYQIIPHLRRVFAKFSIPMLFISHSLQEMRMMTDQVLIVERGLAQQQINTEELARTTVGTGGHGYTNLLKLDKPKELGKLLAFHWGNVQLMLVKSPDQNAGEFALNGRDILLFKKHPEATSARNMLACTVRVD